MERENFWGCQAHCKALIVSALVYAAILVVNNCLQRQRYSILDNSLACYVVRILGPLVKKTSHNHAPLDCGLGRMPVCPLARASLSPHSTVMLLHHC